MGVPSFYKWLVVSKYPKIVCKAIEQEQAAANDVDNPNPNGIEFDNLYLDMNGIIHPCFHPDDDQQLAPTSYDDVFSNIFAYIDRLFNIVKPSKLLYIAIDGVAPRAKINQQRSRRFRSAKDKQLAEEEEDRLRLEFEKQGKMVLPKLQCEVNDSNVITPGTEFMYRLSDALHGYIYSRMMTDAAWKHIKVILSDANVPGEGEHKIMSLIRQQRADPCYNPNTRHCLYGLDADLIMLALATHEIHFSLLRENVLVQDPQSCKSMLPNIGNMSVTRKPYEFLHIWLLRECLELDMKIDNLPENVDFDIERIVDDFICMCIFAGNDFLPHMPSFEIQEGALDLMLDVYKKEFKARGGYLVDMSKVKEKHNSFIKLKRVEHFLTSLGSYEDKIFSRRSEFRERKIKQFLRYHSEPEDISESCYAIHDISFDEEKQITRESWCDETEVMTNTKELQRKLKDTMKKKSDLFRLGDFGNDKVKLGTVGYKRRYYTQKFSAVSNDEYERTRKCVVEKYTEGLIWVLHYYYVGVPSWTWYFPFHYGPFASDFVGMSKVQVKFSKGSPFKPLDQLMAVLPPSSAGALPQAYQNLMTDQDSSIIDFYPEDFSVDVDGKRFLWQGILRLSFIDEERLLSETKQLEKKLDGDEALRNKVSADRLFVSIDSKFGESLLEKHLLLAGFTSETVKIDASLSGGLCGLIKPLQAESIATKNARHTSKVNNAVCVFYEGPGDTVDSIFRPMDGVTIPYKTITESDISETQLWHHNQSTRPGNTYTNFSRDVFGHNRNPAPAWRGRGRGRESDRRNTSCQNSGSSTSWRSGRGGRTNNNFWPARNDQEHAKSTSRAGW
ncbi:unnamed protein product [Rhodiola kirilowii]